MSGFRLDGGWREPVCPRLAAFTRGLYSARKIPQRTAVNNRGDIERGDMSMIADELRHRYRRTPPLSLEGSREFLEEMANPPKATPERRRMFERVRFVRALHKRQGLELPGWAVDGDEQHQM